MEGENANADPLLRSIELQLEQCREESWRSEGITNIKHCETGTLILAPR